VEDALTAREDLATRVAWRKTLETLTTRLP
jgi:hypothetical protein